MQSGFITENSLWTPWRPWCQSVQQQSELLHQQLPPQSHLGPSFVNTEGFLFNSKDLITKNKFYVLEDQPTAPGTFSDKIFSEKVNVKCNKKPKRSKYKTNFSSNYPNSSENLHTPKISSNYPTPLKNLHNSEKVKYKNLKIVSCNVRSINNKFKSALEMLHKQEVDICVFSELNVKKLRKFPGYTPFVRHGRHREI